MNATHAIEGDGEITIATQQEGNEIHVVIADNGIGIPPGCMDKLFDPGFTTKGVGVGTGLGLAISYRIIEEHGGHISVESTLGKGSAFRIAIPIHPYQQHQIVQETCTRCDICRQICPNGAINVA